MDIENIKEAMDSEVESIVDDGQVCTDIPGLVVKLLYCSRTAVSCYATSPSKYVVPHMRHAAGHIVALFNKLKLPVPPMPNRPRQPRTLADWILHLDSQTGKIASYQTGGGGGQVVGGIASLYIDLITACDAHGLEPKARNPNRGQKS